MITQLSSFPRVKIEKLAFMNLITAQNNETFAPTRNTVSNIQSNKETRVRMHYKRFDKHSDFPANINVNKTNVPQLQLNSYSCIGS